MRGRTRAFTCGVLLLLRPDVRPAGLTAQTTDAAGAVVEEVTSGSAPERAGVRVGDVLLEWSTAPVDAERHAIKDPFDLIRIDLEQAPLQTVYLFGRRNDTRQAWVLGGSGWRLGTRPVLAADVLAEYESARSQLRSGEPKRAADQLMQIARRPGLSNAVHGWLLTRAARTYIDAKAPQELDAAVDEARRLADRSSKELAILVRREVAVALEEGTNSPRFATLLDEALELSRLRNPDGLLTAQLLHDRGRASLRRGRFDEGYEFTKRSLEIRERAAPDSLVVASSLTNLAAVLGQRGDAAAAEEKLLKALKIFEARGVDRDTSACLSNLASVGLVRRDFVAAERYSRRALELNQRLDPNGPAAAANFGTLAVVAENRGQLASADDLIEQSIRIFEKNLPRSTRNLAISLASAAGIAYQRRLFGVAADYYRRELSLFEQLRPDPDQVARAQLNLAKVLVHLGENAEADRLIATATASLEKTLAPNAPGRSALYSGRALIWLVREDHTKAAADVQRALALEPAGANATITRAKDLGLLAMTQLKSGRNSDAIKAAMEALEITQRLSAGSALESALLDAVAAAYRASGDLESAEGFYRRAIEALETQTGRFGYTEEVRAKFNAGFSDYYSDLIELLVEMKRPGEAFAVLERSRATSLLQMLAERDISPPAELPEDLRNQIADVDADYVTVSRTLDSLSPSETDRIQAAVTRSLELRRQRETLARKARELSPRFAEVRYPTADTGEQVAAALDPGTLLLAYSVGEKVTTAFALRDGAQATAATLPIGSAELTELVKQLCGAIQRRTPADRGVRSVSAGTQDFAALSARLYDVLLRPFQRQLTASERLAISPDGPLHSLPFAALLDRQGTGRGRYLIESKPVHVIASGTLFERLKKLRRQEPWPAPSVVAFGDPAYSSESGPSASSEPANRNRSGRALEPLPGTRKEVESLAQIYPDAVTYLGSEANERRVRSIKGSVRLLHFATHALMDPLVPLNSAIALTKTDESARDDGLLHAWEIYDEFRVNADLVTLSACDTAVGEPIGGDGLASLSRAFLYAGAQSVLGSLWKVDDAATAELVRRFYGALKKDASKDAALRAAQLSMLRGSENRGWSQPFYWAAFTMSGDWR
jgi:CHAT domain-containing protein